MFVKVVLTLLPVASQAAATDNDVQALVRVHHNQAIVQYARERQDAILVPYRVNGLELLAAVEPCNDHVVVNFVNSNNRHVTINVESQELLRQHHAKRRARKEAQMMRANGWTGIEWQSAADTSEVEPDSAHFVPKFQPEAVAAAVWALPAAVRESIRRKVRASHAGDGDDDDAMDSELAEALAESEVQRVALERYWRNRELDTRENGRRGC